MAVGVALFTRGLLACRRSPGETRANHEINALDASAFEFFGVALGLAGATYALLGVVWLFITIILVAGALFSDVSTLPE